MEGTLNGMNRVMSLTMAIANLHDVFLNASLLRKMMHEAPVETDVFVFIISARARFERVWAAFLYVLIECWRSDSMRPVIEHIGKVTELSQLNSVLQEGDLTGAIERLREVRHYMCHRDRREYWDEGRMGVVGQLEYNERLHTAFSVVLLEALRATRKGDLQLEGAG